MDITKDQIRPKVLSENCWVDLPDGVSLRVDYMTDSMESELRRINRLWIFSHSTEHPDDFYLRAVVKEVKGINYEGEPYKVKLERGLVVDEENRPTLPQILKAGRLYDVAILRVRSVLEFSAFDKKKLHSQSNSSEKEDSKNSESLSPEVKSEIVGETLTEKAEQK